jgi:hypothetical protein
MDELPRFRPPDPEVIRTWEKSAAILDMPEARPEQRLKAMQDALRYTWPDLAIVVDESGWIVYRDGPPNADQAAVDADETAADAVETLAASSRSSAVTR